MSSDITPRRVVCLQPSATLTMRDIGMLDRVVACTRYCADVCPEVTDGSRIIVADSWTAQASRNSRRKAGLGHRLRTVPDGSRWRNPQGWRALSRPRPSTTGRHLRRHRRHCRNHGCPRTRRTGRRRNAGGDRRCSRQMRRRPNHAPRLLRGVGQAHHCLAALGRRA